VSRTAAVLGAAAARTALPELAGFEEIVVLEPSVDALEELMHELRDPRLDYVLGSLPVLPLPDASVDLLVGADPGHDEVRRVLRRDGAARPPG